MLPTEFSATWSMPARSPRPGALSAELAAVRLICHDGTRSRPCWEKLTFVTANAVDVATSMTHSGHDRIRAGAQRKLPPARRTSSERCRRGHDIGLVHGGDVPVCRNRKEPMTILTMGESTVTPDIARFDPGVLVHRETPRWGGASFGRAGHRLSSMPPVEHLNVEQRIGASVWTTSANWTSRSTCTTERSIEWSELFPSDVETGLNDEARLGRTLTMSEVDELIELLEAFGPRRSSPRPSLWATPSTRSRR